MAGEWESQRATPDGVKIEQFLRRAYRLARQRHLKPLERKAAFSLSQWRQQQGRHQPADVI